MSIRNFTNLRALSISKDEPQDARISENSKQHLLRVVHNAFRYGAFPKLEELQLRLLLAYDFGLLSTLSDETAQTETQVRAMPLPPSLSLYGKWC